MKKLLPFIFLAALVLTLGCPQVQKAQTKSETGTCNFVGGKGIVLVTNVPYSEVYAGDTIEFTLGIENRGDAKAVIKEVCIYGIDPSLIQSISVNGEAKSVKGPCIDINEELDAAQKVSGNIIPGGAVDLDFVFGTPKDIKNTISLPVTVKIVYDYTTYITGSVCLRNPYSRSKGVCKSGTVKDLCVSGGPLKLEDIKVYIRKPRNANKAVVILTLSLNNVGGEFYTQKNEYKAKITINVKLNNNPLTCGTNNQINVPPTGKFAVRCRGEIPIQDLEAFNYGYYVPLEIEISYTYVNTWSYMFKVSPIIE